MIEPLPGLQATLFAMPGKAPRWREGAALVMGEAGESTDGVLIEASGRRLAYVPGCARVSEEVRRRDQSLAEIWATSPAFTAFRGTD